MYDVPQIDVEKCTGCGLCVDACNCRIIAVVDGKATIIPRAGCSGCRNWCTLCEDVCPHDAIYCAFEVVIENTSENN